MSTIRKHWQSNKFKHIAIILFTLIFDNFGQSEWELKRTLPPNMDFTSIAYGNGKFIAVGADGEGNNTILLSTDGAIWKYIDCYRQAGWLESVSFGDSIFVVVGEGGLIITSVDCTTWTSRESGTSQLNGVTYANNKFVAVGGANIITSPNGIVWSIVDSNSGYFRSVTYGNGKFVAVGDYGSISYSTDGLVWTDTVLNVDNISSVIFGNNKFVAVGGTFNSNANPPFTAESFISSDGITWEKMWDTLGYLHSVAFGNNTYMALFSPDGLCNENIIFSSSDGITWNNNVMLSRSPLRNVTYVNNQFIAAGSASLIFTSFDGTSWAGRSLGASNYPNSVVYGNGRFVVADYDGTLLNSIDGKAWSDSGWNHYSVKSVLFANNHFLSVGQMNTISTSTNGVEWTIRTEESFINEDFLYSVVFGDSTYVVVGYSGKIYSSPDGVTWTREESGTSKTLYSVTYGNSLFTAVGDSGIILISPDHKTWTTIEEPDTNKALRKVKALYKNKTLYSVTFGSNVFVAVGDSGTILSSLDGNHWLKNESGITTQFVSVTYANAEFVARSKDGTLLFSKVNMVGDIHQKHNKTVRDDIIIKRQRNGIIALFPNSIISISNTLNVKLFNSTGRMIYSSSNQVLNGRLTIPNLNLANCLYFISISDHNNSMVVPYIIAK